MADALPEGWSLHHSSSQDRDYYFNAFTGEATWVAPDHMRVSAGMASASHILMKHTESRRPKDRSGNTVTRTKAEAHEQIQAIRERIVAGETFYDLAIDHSDCSSGKRGGNLGVFGKTTMTPEFTKVTFSLQVGQLSEPFESPSGVHIVVRTG